MTFAGVDKGLSPVLGVWLVSGVGLTLTVVLGGEHGLSIGRVITAGSDHISSGSFTKGPTGFGGFPSEPAILFLRNFTAHFCQSFPSHITSYDTELTV
jgi:hypothetical protein